VDNRWRATAEQHKNEAIRDAFIAGLKSNSIRQRLLERRELDMETAFDNARSLEMAEKQSQSYFPTTHQFTAAASGIKPRDNSSCSEINEATSNTNDIPSIAVVGSAKCYFCGYGKHPRSRCPARDAICKTCGKKGHFQKVCRSGQPPINSNHNYSSATNHVLSVTSAAAAPECLQKAIIQVSINNKSFSALVDSGSSESYINAALAKEHNWPIIPSSSMISMASTTLMNKTEGHCHVNLRYKQSEYSNIKLSLLPNACTDVILGHDFICKHSELRIQFLGNRPPLVVCGVAAAKVESPALFANLDAQCRPIATKSRRHSKEDEKFISSEIEQLLRNGIIEKSNSPWRAQVLVTTNENHKRRMVVDYSQTINRYTYLDTYPQKHLHEMIENVSQFKMFSALDLKSAYHQIPLRSDEKSYTAFEANGNLYQFKRIPFGVTNGVSCFQRIIDDIISKEKLSGTFAYIDNVTICGNDRKSHDENLKQFMKAAEKYGITFNDSKSIIGVEKINMLGYRVAKGTIRPDPERFESLRQMKPPTSPKSLQRIIGLFSYYSQWISHFSDKIRPLSLSEKFPLSSSALSAFESLKSELESAVLVTVDQKRPLVLETDASDVAIAATLNQDGRPVTFFSRTLNSSERNHSAVEKEAYAIVEAIRKWKHYLINSQFTLVTDQKSISFIFDKGQKGKIKNDKIQRWRIELSPYSYDIVHRPGSENHAPDALSRCCSLNSGSVEDLSNLHAAMCHPGVVRMSG